MEAMIMNDAPETAPNKTLPDNHRDDPTEAVGVGEGVADGGSELTSDTDSPLTDDMAPPGTDPEGEQMPD
jgi:hypothetical protein